MKLSCSGLKVISYVRGSSDTDLFKDLLVPNNTIPIYIPSVVGRRRFLDVVVVDVVGGGCWQGEVEVDVGDGGVLEVAGRDHRGVLPALRRVQRGHVEVNLERMNHVL